MSTSFQKSRLVSLKRAAALAVAALGIAGSAVAVPASAEASNKVLASGSVYILDDDWGPFDGGDDSGTFDIPLQRARLEPGAPATRLLDTTNCVDDEVRVRWWADAAVDQNDWLHVWVYADLYEGASCDTNDYDGHFESGELLVPPDGSMESRQFRVNNNDEGGDYSVLTLDVEN